MVSKAHNESKSAVDANALILPKAMISPKLIGHIQGAKEADFADFLAILNVLSEGFLVIQDEKICYYNQVVCDFLGFDTLQGDLTSIPYANWIHPDDMAMTRDYAQRRTEGLPVPNDYDFRLVRTDHTICWVNCRVARIMWQGRVAIAGSLRDITSSKILREEEQQSHQLFKHAFELSPELMAVASLLDGRFIDVNPAFLNIFGQRRSDVIGKSSRELGIWADPSFFSRFREELKMTASMTDMPATLRTRGNLMRHFRLFAQKIHQGLEPVVLIIGRDITDDLMQAQELQHSRDIAELANRAKSEFLANMSHELRTPLNAILGFAEILKEEILGPIGQPRYKEYAGDIHKSGAHLLSIINDILDLSKVEAGRLEAHLSWIDPLPALQLCVNLMRPKAQAFGLEFKTHFAEGYMVEADERLIKQICLNLLSNALKFTPDGGRLFLSLEATADAGLCLSIEDTGIGMTAEEIKVAKRPFGQINNGLAREHEGSGLGLPLVAAFSERLHATMRIASTPHVGTKVSVFFLPDKVKKFEPEN